MSGEVYQPDLSPKGKLRRRLARLYRRAPAPRGPGRPMVSFAFDDAPASAARAGAAILEQRGVRGTYFIAAGLAGETGHMGPYAAREEVVRLAQAGHEIACHTFSHLDCGQANEAEVAADLDRNAQALSEWGLPPPVTFAYPYGDVGFPAKRLASRRFALSRALNPGVIGQGADLNQAPAVPVEGESGEARALAWLEKAQRRNGWVILFTHGVEPRPTRFGASEAALARLVDAALARGFEVATVAEGAARVRAA